ncbi:hypothetical protein NKG05_26945 [Oerskovia sp. M15]
MTELLGRLWSNGGGAERQRAWFAGSGDLRAVIERAAEATLA